MTGSHPLAEIVNWQSYPLDDERLRARLTQTLNTDGVVCLDGFLRPHIVDALVQEA